MMKARLIPVYFPKGRDEEFDKQVAALETLFAEEVEILPPMALGESLPEAEAVVFPQLLGEAYQSVEALRNIQLPRLIITSQFGTVSMWDWEIISYLATEGIDTISSPHLEQNRLLCRALGVRRELNGAHFVVYQDNPGKGFQPEIFKRFYWWEPECIRRMEQKFGVTIVKKSYRELAERAKSLPDQAARQAWQAHPFQAQGLTERSILSALKLYLALKEELEQDPRIRAMGTNCLNESHFSDTTPCLAWNLLFEETGLLWGCEADVLTMLTEYILVHSLRVPLMMTNLYPFLMGEAATAHEHIPGFPDIPDYDQHILTAHCGYLGVVPTSFSTEWALKPKVLAIVDDNASAIDARLAEGPITLAKLGPTLDVLSLAEAELTGYVQFPNSHCLNGALLRVADGRRLMDKLVSHHYLLVAGHQADNLRKLAKVFELTLDEI